MCIFFIYIAATSMKLGPNPWRKFWKKSREEFQVVLWKKAQKSDPHHQNMTSRRLMPKRPYLRGACYLCVIEICEGTSKINQKEGIHKISGLDLNLILPSSQCQSNHLPTCPWLTMRQGPSLPPRLASLLRRRFEVNLEGRFQPFRAKNIHQWLMAKCSNISLQNQELDIKRSL